jgi:hypothetical protein
MKPPALTKVNGQGPVGTGRASAGKPQDVPVWDLSAGGCSAQATLNLNLFLGTPGIWTKSRSGNTLAARVLHHLKTIRFGFTGLDWGWI